MLSSDEAAVLSHYVFERDHFANFLQEFREKLARYNNPWGDPAVVAYSREVSQSAAIQQRSEPVPIPSEVTKPSLSIQEHSPAEDADAANVGLPQRPTYTDMAKKGLSGKNRAIFSLLR